MKEHGQDSNESARLNKDFATNLDVSKIWRPWLDSASRRKSEEKPGPQTHRPRYEPYRSDSATFTGRASQHSVQEVMSTFKHPVRLYWTKAAYDYMYESGEALLRNFPVQATIQIVENYDSSDDEEEDDDNGEGIDFEEENEKPESK